MRELQPGEDFAGHRIEAVGGRGGMGIVYRAVHLALNRTVAVKVISPALAADPDFRQRFQREAQLAASIDHVNVIDIYDASEAEGLLFITMRWVEGTDLSDLLQRYGRLEPGYAVRILSEAASAIDAAHARGLVHRDIKPANLLIAQADGHVYLTDFGLTREAGGGGLTRSGMFVGTADYAAPEQIEGGRLDARTDVYALGCVLVEAVTGMVPFDRDSEMSRMWAHVNDPPPHLTDRVPGLPPTLDEVVTRALAKDPVDRYPSAGDLMRGAAAALEARAVAEPERTVATGAAAPAGSVAAGHGPTAGATVVSGGEGADTVVPAGSGRAASDGATPPSGFPAVAPPPAVPPPAPPPPPGGGGGRLAGAPPPPAPAPAPSPGPGPATPARRRRGPAVALVSGAVVLVLLIVVLAALAAVGALSGDEEKPKGNPAGQIAGNPIKAGKDPSDIVFAGGYAWVANLKDGTVTRVRPADDSTRTIKTEGAPSVVTPGAGSIWTWIYNDSVVRIDLKTLKVSKLIDVGSVASSISFGEGALWVSHDKADELTRVDPKTNKVVATIPVPGKPSALDTGDGWVWVATEKGLVQINPADNTILNTIKVGGDPGGLEFNNGTVYVATGNNAITRVDAASGAVAPPIPVGRDAAYYGVGADSLWVDYPVDNIVKRLDLGTRRPIGQPIRMDFNPQGLVYGMGRLWVIDTQRDQVVRIRP